MKLQLQLFALQAFSGKDGKVLEGGIAEAEPNLSEAAAEFPALEPLPIKVFTPSCYLSGYAHFLNYILNYFCLVSSFTLLSRFTIGIMHLFSSTM